MHDQIKPLHSEAFGVDSKGGEDFLKFFWADGEMGLAGLMYGFVPSDEEEFILLSDVSEIANPEFFEFSFDICRIILAVLVFALRSDLLEDIVGVVVLLALFHILFREFRSYSCQNFSRPLPVVYVQEVVFGVSFEVLLSGERGLGRREE